MVTGVEHTPGGMRITARKQGIADLHTIKCTLVAKNVTQLKMGLMQHVWSMIGKWRVLFMIRSLQDALMVVGALPQDVADTLRLYGNHPLSTIFQQFS